MGEQKRFAVALGGVGGCLVIAAVIVVTGPGDVTPPLVPRVSATFADRLPRVPMPSWSDVTVEPRAPRAAGSVRIARLESRDAVPVAQTTTGTIAPASAPPDLDEPRPLPSSIAMRQATMPVVVGHAPRPTDAALATREPARERGPVAGAFVTAGTHVGGGFKTMGRTLKRVF
jgi:hypothetical protein